MNLDPEIRSQYVRLAGEAMAAAQDREYHRMQYGWDETLPRTFWQRLFRRPATIVHHKGFRE